MMASSTKRLTEADWLNHKTEIKNMVLVQRLSNAKIVDTLEKRGLHANAKQLEYQLKKWKLRRKLPKGMSSAGWQYISYQVEKRRRLGKESRVILNGKVVDEATVKKQVDRNQPTTLQRIDRGPTTPRLPEGLIISVSSPIPLQMQCPWPLNIPWLFFRSSFTISIPSTAAGDSNDLQVLPNFLAGSFLVRNHAPIGTECALESEVSHIASQFALFMPEVSEDESFRRAQTIVKGSCNNRYEESLGILLLQISNNLNLLNEYIDLDDWLPLFSLLQKSNIMKTPLRLNDTTNITILVIAEKLFQMAFKVIGDVYTIDPIETSRTCLVLNKTQELIKWLLESGQDPDSLVPWDHFICATGLQVAAKFGFADLVLCLLDKGANPNLVPENTVLHDPLACAIEAKDNTSRNEIINILLKANGNFNQSFSFLTAVKNEDMSIIKKLVAHGTKIANLLPVDLRGSSSKLRPFLNDELGALAYAAGASTEEMSLKMVHYLSEVLKQQNDSNELARLITPDPLLIAAAMGYNQVLALLLDQGIDINAINSKGCTALHTAAYSGHIQTCDILISRGATVEPVIESVDTPSPLHLAVLGGHLHVVQLLHGWGAYIDKSSHSGRDRFSYWDNFLRYNNRHRFEKFNKSPLVSAMTNPEARTTFHYLVLQGVAIPNWAVHYAAGVAKDPELVSFLVQRIGNLNSRGLDGHTPLQAALTPRPYEIQGTRGICVRIALFLLDHGAVVVGGEAIQAIQLGDWELVERILHQDINVATAHPKLTMLHAAVLNGTPDLIQKVLALDLEPYDGGSLCAAVSLANASGGTALTMQLLETRPAHDDADNIETLAIGIASYNQNFPLLELLLEKVPVSQITKVPKVEEQLIPDFWKIVSDSKWTWGLEQGLEVSPLIFTLNSPQVCALLLNHGYRPNRPTLARAADINNLEILKQIWPYYQRRSDESNLVHGPLYHAIENNNLDMVEFLLERGENIDDSAENVRFGRTPLQAAADKGHLTIFNMLVKRGANINTAAARHGGATALQAACIKGYIGIVKALIDLGVDINGPRADKYGCTAIEGAAEHGRIDIVQLLLSCGANTTGWGRLQYLRSIAFAENEGHQTVVRILKSHCGWTDKDDSSLLKVNILVDESFGEDPGDPDSDIDWDTKLEEFYSNFNEEGARYSDEEMSDEMDQDTDTESDEDMSQDGDDTIREIGGGMNQTEDEERVQEVGLEFQGFGDETNFFDPMEQVVWDLQDESDMMPIA